MKTCFASKRIAAFLLAICMTLSMLPMAVSAEENPPDVSQEPAELEMPFEMETEGVPSSGADLLELGPTGGDIGPLDIGIDDICAIGETGYASLTDALEHVADGDTIVLLTTIIHNDPVTIADMNITFDTEEGSLTIETASNTGPALTVTNGSVTVQGNGYLDVKGKAGGVRANKATVTVRYATSSAGTGAYAENGGVITVLGDAKGYALGAYAFGTGSTIMVEDDAISTGGFTNAVEAVAGGHVQAKNAIAEGVNSYGVAVTGPNATVVITRNATGMQGGVWAQGSGSTITVGGDVTANGGGGIGAWANTGAKITIDGTITAENYVKVGTTTKTAADKTTPTSLIGYDTYTDATSTVWLKETAPATDVCQIGAAGYPSLSLALAAVTSGQTIKLLQDIEHTTQITIDSKTVSFDLNGKKLNVITNDTYGLRAQNGGKVYLSDSGTGTGEFNVTGQYGGLGVYGTVDAVSEASVTNATGVRCGVDASGGVATVYGDVTATGHSNDDEWGVKAAQGSTVTVHGDAVGHDFGVSADRSTVTVYADANGGTGANSTGVKAEYESTVTVKGDAKGGRQGVSVGAKCMVVIEGSAICTGNSFGTVYGVFLNTGTGPSSTLTVHGDVTADGDNAYGAVAKSSWTGAVAQITIDGSIQAAKYIMVGDTEKAFGSGIDSLSKAGYKEYADTRNTIWVKDTASPTPLDTPTGLVWDTATAGTVKAKWVAVAGAQRYAVRLYKSGVYQGLLETNATNLHLTSYLRSFGTGTYTFTVKALAPSGSVDYTDSLVATSAPYAYTAPVCQIGSTGYATLGAAITDALNAGGATTITLLQNINEAAPITVDSADITFALDSFDLTIDTSAAPGSTALTVQNGGKVSCSGSGKLNVEGSQRGVRAVAGSEIHISGSVTAGQYGISTSGGSGNPRITVDGNVTATGQGVGASGEVEAVSAGGNATVVIGGNVTANRTVETQVVTGIYSNGSTVTVGRNVTTQGSGLNVQNDGHVTIDGMLNFNPTGSGSQSYIKLGFPAAIKTADDFELISSRPGYKEYKNGANIVWVKGSEQLGKPTGLAWDTSAGELKATWSAVPNADQYKVEYYKDGTKLGMSTIVSSPSTSTEDIKGNLLASGAGSYTFTVQATAAAGSGYIDSDVSSQSGSYSNTPGGTNYIVTVSGSHAGITGAGNYTQGTTVTIHAGNRSGYSFVGWTSSDVAITNADNKDASFVMPGKAVTVTANWSYNSGGVSNGGGYTPEPPKDTITADKLPNMPTVAKISVSGMAKNSVLSSTITEQMAEGAIKAAQDAAKKSGKAADGIAVDFNVTGSGNNASLNITIDAGAIDRLKEAGVKFIKIGSAVLDVTLDTSAIAELDKQSTGTVTVSAKMQTKLSKAAKALIGSRPVWDITVHYQKNGKTKYISSFGRGTVTLGIAYKAASNENTGSLLGVYVDKDGKPKLLTNSSYAGGRLIFSRNSLSTYGVGYKPLAPAFTDTRNHWAKDNIDFVVSRNLISGISTTTFAPNTAITCADFLMALGRLSGADVSSYKASSFTDVKATDPAMPYIEWAVKAKIVQGIGGGKFGPALSISRQDMAVMMQNYAKATGCKLPVSVAAVTFSDSTKIAAYAKEAAKALQQAGIMQGRGNNTFDPQGNATRAEASSILRRFVELVIDESTARGWVQNDAGQWQYLDENGKPIIGWLVTENSKYHYYFGKDGIMTAGKWLQIDGNWYYFYADGALAKNIKVDGYEVDENGVRKTK